MWSRKIKDFRFPMFDDKSKLIEQRQNYIVTTKKMRIFFSNDFSWDIKSPSSTNKRNKTGIFKFFAFFSKIWKIGEI